MASLDLMKFLACDTFQLGSEHLLGIGAKVVLTGVGFRNAMERTVAGAAPTCEIREG